jgi:transaldolase
MKATQRLHELGQSLWIDHITRDLLDSGQLKHAIDEFSVTGLTFDPAAFEHAIKNSAVYDVAIRKKLEQDISGEDLFMELAMEDLRHAADLLRPIYDRTDGMDGWVSLDVSPLLAHDTANTLTAAKDLYVRAQRPNLLIAIPGTEDNLPVVEEAILAGVPVNVTLLFSREHYLAAAEAFLRGIERRITAGLRPNVVSVVSLFISHWDDSVKDKVPDALHNQLGIAMAKRTYKACREFLSSPRWERAYNAGARPQRLVWAGTETKKPKISEVFYVKSLGAPLTVNTMSEGTLKVFADYGDLDALMPVDGGDCEAVLSRFVQAGIDIDALAARLQEEGVASSVKSWIELMMVIASKSAALIQEREAV